MGVQGLMSFIMQRSHLFLEPAELHDTYLVIDAGCIFIQLYHLNNCNCCFGGDYEKFAFYVNQFFDELMRCNITPIVCMDGGYQDKKFSTIYKRRQESVYKISNANPHNKQQSIPILASVVFKHIIQKRKLIYLQSVFEADNDIASIAKILDCPILSFDSDFFLFDVLYIPFSTLKEGTFSNVTGNGYFKQCQIFKSDYLIKNYPGLRKSVLPLSAALLGNDFVNPIIFKNFFSTLKVPKHLKQMYLPHLRIEALLKWLQNHSLDSAITSVLDKIDVDKQQQVIETIEMIINEYLNLNISPVMLELLGFSQKEINTFVNSLYHKPYKFEKLNNFEIEEKIMDDECYLSFDESDLINTLSLEEDTFFCKSKTKNLSDIIPSWFLREYHAGMFPSYFLDIINRECIFVFEQIENLKYPTTFNISLKILSVIFRLLTTRLNNNSNILKYITRGNGIKLVMCELDCNKYEFNFSIPCLEKLKDYPVNKKKQIFINTMGVSEELLVKFPPKWRLHITSIMFWLNEADKMFTTKYHLYALIFNIIWHVIKTMKHSNSININQVDKRKESQCSFLQDMPIKDALEKVSVRDCIASEEFFISQMYVNKRQFDVTIVHAFALFQNCLKSCIHLNSLLGDIFPQLNVAEFFNGILVYNIYNDIKYYKKLNQHICVIFENSPSLLQLFVSISKQILPI